jgi:hypothetical protein
MWYHSDPFPADIVHHDVGVPECPGLFPATIFEKLATLSPRAVDWELVTICS